MLISSHTYPFTKLGDAKKIIKLLKDSGFEAYDFTMSLGAADLFDVTFFGDENYEERAKELRKYADSIGIICNQAHAPFGICLETLDLVSPKALQVIEYTHRAIKIAGILGAKTIIVHPLNFLSPEENKKMYSLFIDDAKKANIKIALENMWNWAGVDKRALPASCSHLTSYLENYNLLPHDIFTCCLDIGHAEMYEDTSAVEMIYGLNTALTCLHVHDNDKLHDSHGLPFTMSIDFISICKALKDVGYNGDITLEVEIKPDTDDELGFFEMAKKYKEAAVKLRNLIKGF